MNTRDSTRGPGAVRLHRGAVLLLAGACLSVAGAAPLAAQSALERPTNLSGGWTDSPGPLHFHVVHRFNLFDGVVFASPTFHLASGLPHGGLVGARYATSSNVVPGELNEFELFTRWRPPDSLRWPVGLAVQGGYNTAARSLDGEVTATASRGPVTVVGSGRAFSSGYDGDEARFALGAGAVLRASRHTGLAFDAVSLIDREGRERVAWSAAVLLGIPFSPHTLSLHATNAHTATLQGSSRGDSRTRWGFEFTIPVSARRLIGRPPVAPPSDPLVAGGEAGRDTVYVSISDLGFGPDRIEVRPGTTIVWINWGQLAHNVSADDDGAFLSPLLEHREIWTHTFSEPGTHSFHCTPHPFMQGEVVVTGVADTGEP